MKGEDKELWREVHRQMTEKEGDGMGEGCFGDDKRKQWWELTLFGWVFSFFFNLVFYGTVGWLIWKFLIHSNLVLYAALLIGLLSILLWLYYFGKWSKLRKT